MEESQATESGSFLDDIKVGPDDDSAVEQAAAEAVEADAADSEGGEEGAPERDLASEVYEEAKSYLGEDVAPVKDEVDDEGLIADFDDDEIQEAEGKPGRAQKRIRSLLKGRKQDRQELDALRGQLSEMQQYLQQQHEEGLKRQAELDKQMALSAKEMELYRQGFQRPQEDLDPLDKFSNDIQSRTIEKVKSEYDQKLAEITKRQEDYINGLKQQQQTMERQERINYFSRQADEATAELLKGHPDNMGLRQAMRTNILNYAAAHNITPAEAGKEFQKFAYKYALADMKVRGKKKIETRTKAQSVPQSVRPGARPASGKKQVTHEDATSRGFSNALEALVHDNPPDWAA